MSQLPKLTQEEVASFFDDRSFSRGRNYYNNDAIQHPMIQGSTIKGQCYGTAPVPYRVKVSLNDSGIVSADCSCPLGGNCKHCVALLLTWIHEPDEFSLVEELTSALADWDKDALIALINTMVERKPELESLIELQRISKGGQSKPLSVELIMRQVDNAVPDYDDYYDDYHSGYDRYDSESAIYEILNRGDEHAAANEWANAVTIYRAVAERLCSNYEMYYDDQGEIVGLIDSAGEGLGTCLANVMDATLREQILRSMFDIWKWDTKMGGYGAADSIPVPLIEESNPEEKALVAKWVRNNMPSQNSDRLSDWGLQKYGQLLLSLEADTLDDEAFIEACRRTNRHGELLDRLLKLKRLDEAIAHAQTLSDYELVSHVDRFVNHGHRKTAWDLAAARAKQSSDSRLNKWLKEQAKKSGDATTALEIAQAIFWNRPSVAEYSEIKSLANEVGKWPTTHVQIVKKLTEQKNFETLTEIHLADGEIENALNTLLSMNQNHRRIRARYFSPSSLSARVAAAAKESHPDAAIRIYLELAEETIAGKNRKYYSSAASVLKLVRQIYQARDQDAQWRQQIAHIRSQYQNLRAMQDEFDKAGLG